MRRLIRRDFDLAFQEVDLIAGPVAPTPAYKIGEKVDGSDVSVRLVYD